jgi:small GTP-binding protein
VAAEKIGQLKPVLKLIVFGEGGVGKTTMIHRFITGTYLEARMTVGSGFATKNVEVDGNTVTLSIWDFAGEERFRILMPKYCLGAHGGIMAFDLTRTDTFVKLDAWLKIVRDGCPQIPLLLIGNKSDLNRFVSRENALEYTEQNSLNGYIETSSKDDSNVSETFQKIAELMWRHSKQKSEQR